MNIETKASELITESPGGLRHEMLWLLAGVAVLAAGLILAGRLSPWISPDTAGYFNLGSWPDFLTQPRNPLYSWLVGWLPGGHSAVPAVQSGFYFLAVALLHRATRIYGISARAAASVSVSLLFSNVILLWNNAVHPELSAVAFAVLSLAHLFLLAVGRHPVLHVVLAGLFLGLAYVLRPTFLPAIVLFPMLYLVLRRLRGAKITVPAFLGVLIACALPFLAVSSVRLATVRDFNVVSFGGFQMSGMAGLMLNDNVIRRLPADVQPLAKAILEQRMQAENRGAVIPTPSNSSGQRSFVSAALGYYDLYARTYDALLYNEIGRLRRDEDWVSWNKRLMRFSVTTVMAAPDYYMAWVVGGTSRAVGRLFVTNLPFIRAGFGDDLVIGYAGNDTLLGDDGNDIIGGGAGNDVIIGGNGYDTASFGGFSTNYTFSLNYDGSVTVTDLTGGWGTDIVSGVEAFYFDNGTFSLSSLLPANPPQPPVTQPPVVVTPPDPYRGSDGGNTIVGDSGSNTIKGFGGNDLLKGGAGSDFIYGGLGNDKLYGGSGKDSFVFDTKPNKTTNKDTIYDFRVVDDTIRIDNAVYTKVGANGVLKSGAFWASKDGKAHDTSDRIIYDKDGGQLYYDADGSGKGAAVQFAQLTKNLAMTYKDFYIV